MPVLETLGGALFGAVLQLLFDKIDSRQVLDYFCRRKLDDKLLKKLKRRLMDIHAVIDDAEQKQFSNSLVKAWVDEVRDTLLDAEDLLDEIDYEFSKCELEAEINTSPSKVRGFESNMIEILDELESLLNQKVVQDFKISSGVGSGLGNKVSEKKIASTSLVAEDIIYGRDEDKEMILNWLTSDNDNCSQLSILSIVGMGGMGKTTLAQHVYNDPRIEGKFAVKVWVCVSDDFDVLEISKKIIEQKDESADLETVHRKLKEKLTGMKFLIVLDDVWNEDRNQWRALHTPLKYGAKGSKILVTTRSSKVSTTLPSNKVHELMQLQEDHSWQVFAKHAFQDNNHQLNVEVENIGKKIVERCKGLPLALETIGCLLHTKSSVLEWEGVLRSNVWDLSTDDSKIIPALLLSYYHLPSHLKRCFAYCALFPKDHQFDKQSLILLWMAENFLLCSHRSKSPEEVGEQYFNDLLSRSFFQQSSMNNIHSFFQQSSMNNIHSFFQQSSMDDMCFVMHDLLNDLAKYVSGDICFRLGVDKEKDIPKTTRHFSTIIDPVKYSHGYGSLYDAKRLRTFMPICWTFGISIQEFISKFKFLRVLTLFRCENLKELPDTLGDLIHLRSLDLSQTEIEKLPDSTCSLCNLQVLKLNYCLRLKELPSTLHKLTNLCRLELEENSLTKLPIHMGQLKNLQILMSPFNVGKSSEMCIQQLRELSLHEQLEILDLQNTVNPLDALTADLKNKTHLVGLDLQWDRERNIDDSMNEREVLENLQPSRHLKHLSISEYGGTQFPRWLSDNSLLNVVTLTLRNCRQCIWLPSLGLLTFLKQLTIEGLDWIERIDAGFYGNSSFSFAALEMLKFYDMKEWEEWECMTGAFPNLQSLYLEECPKLKGHLPQQLCHLKNLSISDCKQLVASIPKTPEMCVLELRDCGKLQIDYHPTTLKSLYIQGDNMEASLLERLRHIESFTSLESLRIVSCPNMNIPMNHSYQFIVSLHISGGCDSLTNFALDFFPKLSELSLRKCHSLQMISQRHPHNHLKSLIIEKCSQFESFPKEGLYAPQLESFVIDELENFKSLPERMTDLLPALTYMTVYNCPGVEFSDGCLPSNLRRVDLLFCSKLVASLKGALGANTSLKTFTIRKVDVESFPGEGLLPLSLTSLEIYDSPNLEKLDYKGLSQLSSLEVLILCKCPILQCLPEESLPKSISILLIVECPLLTQRCKKEGEDWEKIAHIKDIRIDREKVNI